MTELEIPASTRTAVMDAVEELNLTPVSWDDAAEGVDPEPGWDLANAVTDKVFAVIGELHPSGIHDIQLTCDGDDHGWAIKWHDVVEGRDGATRVSWSLASPDRPYRGRPRPSPGRDVEMVTARPAEVAEEILTGIGTALQDAHDEREEGQS